MRIFIAMAVILALAVSSVAVAEPGDRSSGDSIRGAKYYSDNCGRCHNPRAPTEHRDRDWSIIITHMRITAGLPGQQARDIYAFMAASNNPPPVVLKKSGVVPVTLSGTQIVNQYGCSGCHKIGGTGGIIAPDLQGVFERRDEAWIRAQIQHPRQNNPLTVMPDFGFTDDQVAAIVEVLRAAQ
jgi:mono/diheme cytochrome c family protein